MTMDKFLREFREEIDRTIRSQLGEGARISANERRLWVLNWEPLYHLARRHGVRI